MDVSATSNNRFELASKPTSVPNSAENPPVLGPPLPGDLGPPMLQANRNAGLSPDHSSSTNGVDRQRSAQEVARSSVFFQTGSSAGKTDVATTTSAASVAPNGSTSAFNPMTTGPTSTAAQPNDPTAIQIYCY
jgi:type IV secretory pathway VirB10-like protein